ncbi:hypothetical protein [Streptomyces sp. NPDC102437]|uniref:hypothetical protein n=1 Tax=Streptomyces sp. NPDC102437 TaxID=3366175 RepID=UPI00382D88D5
MTVRTGETFKAGRAVSDIEALLAGPDLVASTPGQGRQVLLKADRILRGCDEPPPVVAPPHLARRT